MATSAGILRVLNRRSVLVLIFIALTLLILWRQAVTNTKTLLFISQGIPEIPVKPLELITSAPNVSNVEIGKNNNILANIYFPANSENNPALIISMGVNVLENDRPLINKLGETFSRLGYVTMWPRSKELENGTIRHENPQVFVESFNHLKSTAGVDPERISFFGISSGSSVALVAAEDPTIADQVHSVLFFGGYYNILDYFILHKFLLVFDKKYTMFGMVYATL